MSSLSAVNFACAPLLTCSRLQGCKPPGTSKVSRSLESHMCGRCKLGKSDARTRTHAVRARPNSPNLPRFWTTVLWRNQPPACVNQMSTLGELEARGSLNPSRHNAFLGRSVVGSSRIFMCPFTMHHTSLWCQVGILIQALQRTLWGSSSFVR